MIKAQYKKWEGLDDGYEIVEFSINQYKDKGIRVTIEDSRDIALIFAYSQKNTFGWAAHIIYQYGMLIVPIDSMEEFLACCRELCINRTLVVFEGNWKYIYVDNVVAS